MMQEEIRFATAADTAAVRALWELCFPSEDSFNDYFFSHIYQPQYNLLLLRGGTLCAMTQMLPYTLLTGGREEPVTYIYGACTHPNCRRQHMMDQLLHRSFAIDRAAGRAASMLIPQEAWLYDFYASFGYQTGFYNSEQTFTRSCKPDNCLSLHPMTEADFGAVNALFYQAVGAANTPLRTDAFWRQQQALFTACGRGAFCAFQEDKLAGYAFVWPAENGLWAQECVVITPDLRQAFADALLSHLGGHVCRMTGPDFSISSPIGCILRYDGRTQAGGYLNLMLN